MRRALVVEDDPHNAVLFRKVLERRGGFHVTLTESPEEVLHLAGSGAVDLIIMDVSLANSRWQGAPVNGVDLTRMLKAHASASGIPVLLATAHAMRGDAEKLVRDSGADGYVAKPILDFDAFVRQALALLGEAA